ncbi:MAG: VCBS repeat-containing protein, partial [Candidatus Thalassarchaeum sp.]|nr:VCBS repeat-containing protein [Candidatus Thalassarchaeum sp.]
MLHTSESARNRTKEGRTAVFMVLLMLTSLMVSLVPAVSASHITQYAVQRDPAHLTVGDLNCDGHNDILAVSVMGHYITALYNDGQGNFADRQDVFISNNDSQRAGFVDTANSVDAEIADIDGDGVNDIVYYQENIRFVGESFVRPGNLTTMWGDCSERVNQWEDTEITVSNPYHLGMEVGDIDEDENDDIILITMDATATNQYIQIYRGTDPSLLTNQQSIPVPLTNGMYVETHLGHWGETVQGSGIPGGSLGDCEDLDLWLLRTPPYNTGVGTSVGHYDNMTVLEFDCITNQYPNPLDATAQGIHEFKLDAEHNYPLYGLDIADTNGDNEIDLIAAVDGITGNISYATRSGSSWNTQNYVYLGDYLGASITIVDVNQDGEVDFFVPTEVTLTRLQDSSAQNQTYLLLENLREINSVEIILANPSGPGYLSSLSFDVGRRPTMAIPGQLQGGDDSAYEIIIGQRDYSYRFSDGAMWLDTQGWAGAGDFLSVLTLDNEDVGITGVTIAPASYNPATGQAEIGEGTRWVNVTVKNTGLNPLTGSVDVDLEVKEVLGGTDTVVYSNDFEGNEDTTNCSNCVFAKHSYTGMYGTGASSWHIEANSTADTQNVSWYEADSNPTNYYWAGMDYNGDNESDSGYYNNMDEALILENVDLTGADAAYMDLSVMCTTAFFELYLAEQYSVVERWLYEDSCGIEVWTDGNGWESVFFAGGWDNERFFRIYYQGVDPEYNTYNGNFNTNTATGWLNYTEGGGTSPDPDERESIDLTRYAGQIVDIRFRFRSGLMGSVGPAGSSQDTGLDGFAFDNITIRKRDVTFGTTETVSQTLNFNDFAAGASEEVVLTADFIDNRTYYVKTELTNPTGFTNMDDLNDEIKFQLTVNNLFDPCLAEEHWVDLENGVRYASGEREIRVKAQNCGNTLTDFQLEAFIQNAEPDLIAIEDFSGVEPMWSDDGNENGSRLDDSTGSNDMLPQNVGVFNSHAYWLGHPSDGYGDNWNETVTLDPIPVASTGADFTYLTFDYYAEGDYL